ncbi:heat shock protein DnaJ domain protein [Striga asiatica]|uniref:Heat shock protein DnaJ domain protein n=1 Tax=Striga asiatica TaxID=4170 RepID=A0A5A7R2W1_STRAF|nr:heat shock protein DnaJ domain protein [Striga asiatica]
MGLEMSQTSTTQKFRGLGPSRLKYEDRTCDQCGIKVAVKIVGPQSPNFQKLYYHCDRHRFIGWANPINEDEVSIREEVSTSEKSVVDRESYKDVKIKKKLDKMFLLSCSTIS